MAIAAKIESFIEGASWIRKMFEEGERLRKIHGAENVYDFTLGNPDIEPPAEFSAELLAIARVGVDHDDDELARHSLMPFFA